MGKHSHIHNRQKLLEMGHFRVASDLFCHGVQSCSINGTVRKTGPFYSLIKQLAMVTRYYAVHHPESMVLFLSIKERPLAAIYDVNRQ